MRLKYIIVSVLLVASIPAWSQQGDRPGEDQQLLVPKDKIPPAPALPPEEALKSFQLQDGFRIELVASEPLVESPVAVEFGPDGRLWVLELRGFMPNPDGVGEQEPVGRISVLDDMDGDGRMDRSTVFKDGLVLARAMMLLRQGLVVAEPPNLYYFRDLNGDGRADQADLLADDYAKEADPKLGPRANVEHSANSLLWGMDNWIYSANYTTRFRNVAGVWQSEPTVFRGQWGLTQDDYGRLFFNSNSDQLRGDLVPAHYLSRNPNYPGAAGANVRIAQDQSVWPSRVNPGVNRGYRRGQLRDDGTLATFTGACGPVIYRGDQFPAAYRGNAFVCEPTGNLIKRNLLLEKEGVVQAKNAYEKTEFLTSTDERFRPVNLHNGPDGALYVVDMYRGIIQHRIYLTTYLRNQVMDRGLESPVNLGRIYRIVHPGRKPASKPALHVAASSELVKHLAHPNGWWRDTAQRLLVERNDLSVVPSLRKLAAAKSNPLAQIHALWTLDGLLQSDRATLLSALKSPHSKVRAAGIRLSEPFLKDAEMMKALLGLQEDPSAEVRLQLAFTLGEARGNDRAEAVMASILLRDAGHAYIRDAVITGLGGRELEFLERILTDSAWAEKTASAEKAIEVLAACVFNEGIGPRIHRLLELASRRSGEASWQRLALLDGVISTMPANPQGRAARKITPKKLEAEPAALVAFRQSDNPELRTRLEKLDQLILWPGKSGVAAEQTIIPLTAEEEARFKAGKDLYLATCGACHQLHGNGQEGLAPPLVDTEWTTGSLDRLIRITLHGLRGPLTVNGKLWELEMPQLSVLDDEQIAAVLTYVRREWGHTASPVDPKTVAKIRAETADRLDAWTEAELLKIP